MTPAEIEKVQWAYLKHQEQRQDDLVRSAYVTAALTRRKRLPSLAVLLAKPVRLTEDAKQALQDQHERLMKELG